jgi:hypothetical protein
VNTDLADLAELKEALDGVADRVHARPPLREDIDRSLHRVRRRRRATRVAQTAGALLGVAGLLGAVQVTGVPLPSWAPAVKVGPSAASALAGQPTRGSLAGDVAWLRALREKVATFDRSEGGGERWRAPSADDVDVVFAGDVGPYRVAVVETTLRWGVIESRTQLVYLGPAGAAGSALEEGFSSDPQDVVHVDLTGVADVPVEAGSVAVVIGPAWLDVRKVDPLTIRANGDVRLESAPAPSPEPGVWQVEVPRGGERVWLMWGNGEHVVAVGDVGPVPVEAAGPARTALLEGVRPAQRAGSVAPDVAAGVPDDDRLAASVAAAQYASGLPREGTSRRLVWSGTLGGVATDLVDVVAPSGGHAVVAVQGDTAPGGGMSAVHVSAAAKGEPAAMAWTYQGMQQVSADTWHTGGPFHVGLFGPPAAVRAVVETTTGQVAVDLADGIGWVQADGARSVAFLDEGGSTVAGTSVKQPDGPTGLGPVVTG